MGMAATGGEQSMLPVVDDASSDQSKPSTRQIRIDRIETAEGEQLSVFWPVDARKLQTYDTSIVSPSFDVNGTVCKLMVKAASMGYGGRGQRGFKGTKGRGIIQLKSEAGVGETVLPITFRLSLTSGTEKAKIRGPVTHDFANGSVCGLPPNEEEWNLDAAVDRNSQTFVVRLDVEPTKMAVS